ncbi:ferritin-like protein [Bradyrhizobium jicamae]|uniref:ferritin-like domain-containing protein n=1 Tax=Bradyrhizobium jicamae TaxID=280332 RepID=UPI001BAB38B3|nr:ferritin-like protein [Bradyrhizobium jicamae]MBR0756716.1 ferritin-like protein [Bradyrhizobium jicamae]
MKKSIAQFVSDGISTLPDLQAALQTAMQLEFATIPPYLCAQWSINDDPSNVQDLIEQVVVQEMFHFALAGNMLSAIGGTVSIANANFVPTYPTHKLPGGIPQKLAVDLQPLSPNQLQVFMQIELPEFPPVALMALRDAPATIGAFYDTIAAGFTAVQPAINLNANFVNMKEATQIKSIADAQAAIALIKAEGEGTPGDPDQPPPDNTTELAHYYQFKEVFVGKQLVQTNGKWGFTGAAIQMPTVFNFTKSTITPDPSLAFNQAMSSLLTSLQSCWTDGGPVDIGAMFSLADLGRGLIQQGIQPEFQWAASGS